MADITPYITAAATGIKVASLTRNASDGFPAGAYAAWVQSITGDVPTVLDAGSNRAKIVLTQAQTASMRTWIDTKISASFTKSKTPPAVQYEFGPVVMPIVWKYALLLGGAAFLAGYFTKSFVR